MNNLGSRYRLGSGISLRNLKEVEAKTVVGIDSGREVICYARSTYQLNLSAIKI